MNELISLEKIAQWQKLKTLEAKRRALDEIAAHLQETAVASQALVVQ